MSGEGGVGRLTRRLLGWLFDRMLAHAEPVTLDVRRPTGNVAASNQPVYEWAYEWRTA